MNRLEKLDAFELPTDLEEADAEYFRIKISRCNDNAEAEKYRTQLALIEEALRIKHRARIKGL